MAARDIEAGKAFVRLFVNDSALIKGLRGAQAKLQSFGRGMAAFGGTLSAGGAALLGPLAAATMQFAKAGDDVHKMAARTGLAAEAVSELSHAANLSGTDIKTVETGMRRLAATVTDAEGGLGTAKDALEAVGMSASDLAGLSPEDQLSKIADGIAGISDPSRRAAAAMDIFGRSGTMMIPMLAGGSKGIADMRAEARRLGMTIDGEAAQSAANLTDALTRMWGAIKAVSLNIGGALAPIVTRAADAIGNMAAQVTAIVRENQGFVRMVAAVGAGLLAAGAAIAGFGGFVFLAGSAIGGLATLLTTLGAVLGAVLSPLGLVTAALVAGIVAWSRYTDSGRAAVRAISAGFSQAFGIVRDTIGGIVDALSAGDIKLAAEVAMAGLRSVFLMGVQGIATRIGGILGESLGSVAVLLSEGDFMGAWNAAVEGMTNVLKQAFVSAGTFILDAWKDTVNKITDYILEKASEGGIFGNFLSKILGVDVASEVARGRELNAQLKSKGLGGDLQDPLEEAKQTARDQTDAAAQAWQKRLEEFAPTAPTGPGLEGLNEAVENAKNALAKARSEAAAKAAEVRTATADDSVPPEELQAAIKRSTSVSFSAAALATIGGGTQGDKTVEELRESRRVAKEQKELAKRQLAALEQIAMTSAVGARFA